MDRLSEAIDLPAKSKPLPPINRDHQLVGNMKDYRECRQFFLERFYGKSLSTAHSTLSPIKMPYELIIYWSKESNAFLVEVPELPGCITDGAS